MKWDITQNPEALFEWLSLKPHLRIDDDSFRGYVMDDLLPGATAHVENSLQTSLMQRAITAQFNQLEPLNLPRGPVIEVTSVKDNDGNDLAYTTYRVGNSDRIKLDSTVNVSTDAYPIIVVYSAGYEAAADVPADIVDIIRNEVAIRWRTRDELTPEMDNMIKRLDRFYQYRGRGKQVF